MLIVHSRLNARMERDALAADALPPAWFDVLRVLESTPSRRVRLGDLSEAVLLTKAGLSRLIDRIEADGFLRRERCPSDGRGTFAVLTDAGAAAVRRTWPIYRRTMDKALAEALGDDAAIVEAALRRVAAANDWLPELRPVQVNVAGRPRSADRS